MAKGSKLTELDDRQRKAIELLVSGETVSETARLVGVNRKTISDWKTRDFFKDEMAEEMAKTDVEKSLFEKLMEALTDEDIYG